MRIWQKIGVAPAVAMCFLVALGALSYATLSQQQEALEEVFKTRFAGYQLASDSAREVGEVHASVYRLFTWMGNLEEAKIKKITEEQKERIGTVGKAMKRFGGRPELGAPERQVAESLLLNLAKYREDVDTAIALSSVDPATGMAMMQTADGRFQKLNAEFKELVKVETELAQHSYDRAGRASSQAALILLGITLLALVASIAIAFFMTRMIVRPLRSAIDSAARIAAGDLSLSARAVGNDETAQLLNALSEMTGRLRELVAEVASGAHLVSGTSAQIAQGNLDLSQRTEEQASTLEQTASSMEELTSTVSQNAQNARQASQLAVGASEVALKGGDVVDQVVSTMDDIQDASKRIADIIGVIDSIAFQTNILALNAAVEAARAGEQGRGFAVVAAEVRNLAQRSAAAAKEIKTLIGDSVQKVRTGASLADAAGHTMVEVVSSVKKVSDLIAEIAAASLEQSSGIGQVNTAITQMDQVVQQNASLVEEATAATESMREQASTLLQMVSRFKLGTRGAQSAALDEIAAPARSPFLTAPAPIRFMPGTKRAAPVAATLGAPRTQTAEDNHDWEEF